MAEDNQRIQKALEWTKHRSTDIEQVIARNRRDHEQGCKLNQPHEIEDSKEPHKLPNRSTCQGSSLLPFPFDGLGLGFAIDLLLYMLYENHRKHGHCNNTNEEDSARPPRSSLRRRFKVAPSPVWSGERNHSKCHDQAKGGNTQVDPFYDFAEFPLNPIVLDNK